MPSQTGANTVVALTPVATPAVESEGVASADFLLTPEQFVERCLAEYDPDGRLFSRGERGALVEALRAGRPRLDVLAAVSGRSAPATRQAIRPRLDDLRLGWDNFVVVDLLEKYAPDDDEAFVRQAYSQLFGRPPSPVEAMEGKFDLKTDRTTRRRLIEALAARSTSGRLSTDVVGGAGGGMTADGAPVHVLIRPSGPDTWAVSPDVWVQPAPTRDGALQLSEGWVLAGPKRTFQPGPWRLEIDLVQEEAAQLVVEVAANAGLDILLTQNLVGPARLAARLAVEAWHRFLEVRLFRPEQPAERLWLKIRDLSLAACE